ncbi:MAG TPA: diacylglycerol kinase family lipid kinase [Firmicutes bacterium]|nr:diacylglycerol kinase family lipid kinase [Bacillota bacterium]
MPFVRIIVNPRAGRGRSLRVLDKVKGTLSQAGWQYETALTQAPGHAVELARESAAAGLPLVAAIGGDGTINEVIQGISGTSTALAIIPGGTGNDHARSLGIPLAPARAAELLWRGKIIDMDVGLERDRLFGCLVSIGFPVDVIDHTNRKKQLLKGSLAILSSVWQTLRHLKYHHVTITFDDDRSISAATCGIFVLNTPSAGGGLRFSPAADITDGLLDVVVIGEISVWDLVFTLPQVYTGSGRHLRHPAVGFYRCRKIRIDSDDPLPKMFDGEIIGRTPVEASLRPRGLRVVAPVSHPAEGQPVSVGLELAAAKMSLTAALPGL